MKKQKRKPGCIGRFLKYFFIFFILIFVASELTNSDTDKTTPSPTIKPTATISVKPTTTVSVEPTAEPTAEPLQIVLKYPELGEYGRYYTMNDKVEKAEESDKETVIQCFVPVGTYIVTYEGKAPWSYVNVYTEETVISEYGWEEYADAWVSEQLKPGESCEVTIPEGWYIHLNENDIFRLVQK